MTENRFDRRGKQHSIFARGLSQLNVHSKGPPGGRLTLRLGTSVIRRRGRKFLREVH
jgi:hypothetical protein